MVSGFPEPVQLPDSVALERRSRQHKLVRSATRGFLLRALIIGAELAGYLAFNSSSLLLDALASMMDLITTILLVFCIRLAERPPDQNHPFGHGRYEPLAGLQLGLLLMGLGVSLFIQQMMRTASHTHGPIDSRTWLIPFMATFLLEWCYRQASRAAKQAGSQALMAEAWHYRIDALNSLIATVALGAAALIPEVSGLIDHLGALVIAALMILIGLRATRDNLKPLLDHIPSDQFFAQVTQAAKRVEGVLGTEKIRIQLYGPDAHVDIDVEIDPTLSVEAAHRISQNVRAEIQKTWPAVRDVTVHIEPFYPGDH